MDFWVMHGMAMDENPHVFPGGGVGELYHGFCSVPFGPLLCGLLLAGGALLPPSVFPCVCRGVGVGPVSPPLSWWLP